jgi:hypothetical protein
VTWTDFLTKIDKIYKKVLLCPYNCAVSFEKEIGDLAEGTIVVVQTTRSNQSALLRRLKNNEDGTANIEVCTAYVDTF